MTDATAVLDALYEARAHGQGPIGRTLEASHKDALDLQLTVLDRFVAAGDALAGWKVSFTSGKSRDRMGPGFRPFGYVLRSKTFSSGQEVALSGDFTFALEPELCLVLGAPLRGAVDRATARAAVRGIAPAFEINQQRLPADVPDAVRLADGTGNWGIVVGEPVPHALERDDLPATAVRVFANDELVGSSPSVPDMDDPFESLAKLSTLLGAHGIGLDAGARVITGSFTRVPVKGRARWRAEFDDIGSVLVNIS